MAEPDDELVFKFDAQGQRAFERAVRGVDQVLRDLDDDVQDAKDSTSELMRAIEKLNRKARLDEAKASSEAYAAALKRVERAKERLQGSTERARKETGRLGESMITTANQAMMLVDQTIQLGRAVHAFAMRGVDAGRVTDNFVGNMEALQAATGGAINETVLARMDQMARKTGLWGEEIEAVARLATQVSRREGEEFVTIFERMQDASPEQLEKWGVLTSDLVAQLQGLDTVQQKQMLRQELVNQGMAITNEEIAEGTHALERQTAEWENFVSSLEVGVAEMLGSDGVSGALQTMKDDLQAATENIIAAGSEFDSLMDTLGESVGIEDVGIASFFKLGWETSVISQIGKARDRYRQFIRLVGEGGALKTAGAAADMALTAQDGLRRQQAVDELAALMADPSTQGTSSRNATSAARTAWWEANDGFDFTNDSSVTAWQRRQYNQRGGRRRPRGSIQDVGRGAMNAFFGQSEWNGGSQWGGNMSREGGAVGGLWNTGFVDNLSLEGNRGGDMITGVGGGLGQLFESAVGPAGEFAEKLGEISDEMARQREEAEKTRAALDRMVEGSAFGIEELTRIGELSKRSLADQVAAYAGLGSKGVQAVGQYAQAFGAKQKDMAWLRGGVETFETAAALGRYDFWAASQHFAAATGAFAVAGGAFDSAGGGGGRGASMRGGGSSPGAGIGPSTFGPGANLDRSSDRQDRVYAQILVGRRVIGEVATEGQNTNARTYRSARALDARAISSSVGYSLP